LAATFLDISVMTDEINFIALQNRFKEIKSFYSRENYKYIHVKTVGNFLTHSEKFFMKQHKQEIFKTLTEYFDIINSKQIDNITESLELFNKYIRPLTNLFSDLRGFHMASRFWIMLLWTLPFFGLLYFLNASVYFYVVLASLIILIVARQVYFMKQKKTYGFMH
jgi:hypothetical protein